MHTGDSYDFTAIVEGGGDGGVPHGALLMAFGAAVHGRDDAELARQREEVRRTLGEEALVDACGVAAEFEAVVRIADATGIPLEDAKEAASRDLRADLGIDRFADLKKG